MNPLIHMQCKSETDNPIQSIQCPRTIPEPIPATLLPLTEAVVPDTMESVTFLAMVTTVVKNPVAMTAVVKNPVVKNPVAMTAVVKTSRLRVSASPEPFLPSAENKPSAPFSEHSGSCASDSSTASTRFTRPTRTVSDSALCTFT